MLKEFQGVCKNIGKCIKGSTHSLDEKQDFDVSSEGFSSAIGRENEDENEGLSIETSKSCLSPR